MTDRVLPHLRGAMDYYGDGVKEHNEKKIVKIILAICKNLLFKHPKTGTVITFFALINCSHEFVELVHCYPSCVCTVHVMLLTW